MIDQGVTAALAARDALRSTNGDDSIISEQALEGRSELLVNAPTPIFLNVNHYLSKAPKELLVFCSGVKEWSLSFTSATALLKTMSSLLHALFTLLL
uniref:Uncharacterized protein n=1 Tax=Tanacetum cinerariifolium TaxID=118510 RepID=A0A699UJX3_TANCI|nr:hypothetical protein [Tanacetum cinerariifolium]